MSAAVKEILEAALKLDEDDREILVTELTASLHGGFASAEIEASWEEELRRRTKSIDDSTATLVPAEEVFARLEKRFGGR
jgi:putative addiction module component (TIGR02574 family)